MATAKRSKKKKSSRLGKIAKFFNPHSLRGGMALFALVFALGGGGYYAYNAFAASLPPGALTNGKYIDNVKASDGITGNISCTSVTGSTGYGPLANCTQRKPGAWCTDSIRVGFYSPYTKVFSPTSAWSTPSYCGAQGGAAGPYLCKNMNYFFQDWHIPISTVYGPTVYGQIYRFYNNKWQIKWSNMNLINGYCYPTGNWMDAKAW